MPGSVIQGSFPNGVKLPVVQRKGNAPLPPNLMQPAHGTGQPLPADVLQKMESFFGQSFKDVRVFVGPHVQAIGASAYTHGSEIHFGPGQYLPQSAHGQQLLARQLAHVVQQRSGRVRNPYGNGVAVVRDAQLDAEAERLAMRAAVHRPPAEPKSAAVQPMIKAALAKSGLVVATGDGKRPSGSRSKGSQGDHTTAYCTFEHQMINAVYNVEPATAWNNLLATHEAIRDMPGYRDGPKWLVKQSEAIYTTNDAADASAITADQITTYANTLLTIRNRLAYSSLSTSGGSTGSQQVSTHAGGLQAEEIKLRQGKGRSYTKEDIMTAMIKVLDHVRLEKSVESSRIRDAILVQHFKSMLDTYWRVAREYKIKGSTLAAYYKKHSWTD